MKILLGVTGSVAAKLTSILIERLLQAGHEVQIIATKASLYFWNPDGLSPEIKDRVKIWQDHDEWLGKQYTKETSVLHIQLVNWAEVFLIAPLSKNTLFKISHGAADNLLTCVAVAWWPLDERDEQVLNPIVIAPAMNTRMWLHPSTSEQISRLIDWYQSGLVIINPVAKELACGDIGIGALADINDIISALDMNE